MATEKFQVIPPDVPPRIAFQTTSQPPNPNIWTPPSRWEQLRADIADKKQQIAGLEQELAGVRIRQERSPGASQPGLEGQAAVIVERLAVAKAQLAELEAVLHKTVNVCMHIDGRHGGGYLHRGLIYELGEEHAEGVIAASHGVATDEPVSDPDHPRGHPEPDVRRIHPQYGRIA